MAKKTTKRKIKIMNVEIHIHHDRLRKTLINIEIIQKNQVFSTVFYHDWFYVKNICFKITL